MPDETENKSENPHGVLRASPAEIAKLRGLRFCAARTYKLIKVIQNRILIGVDNNVVFLEVGDVLTLPDGRKVRVLSLETAKEWEKSLIQLPNGSFVRKPPRALEEEARLCRAKDWAELAQKGLTAPDVIRVEYEEISEEKGD